VQNLFRLKGINYMLLGAALGLNFFWALLLVMVSYLFISQNQSLGDLLQVGMLVASFMGPFWIGWILAKIAADLHGPSYGLIGSFGGLVPIALVLIPSGIFGFLIAFTTILGGLNGGLFAMRDPRRNH
jgi:threonine/homoserine efflux transporter RhtA